MGTITARNVELVRRAFETFIEGDRKAGLALFARDVVVVEDGGIQHASTYHGHDGLWRWAMQEAGQLDGLENIRFEFDHFIDSGDHVVVLIHMDANLIDTGEPYVLDFAEVWTVRGGVVSEIRVHLDRQRAMGTVTVGGAGDSATG